MQTEHLVRGLNCSRTCETRDHATFGECMRAKKQMVGYCRSTFDLDRTGTKATERDLAKYQRARELGIAPDSTHRSSVDFAMRMSDKYGAAYGYEADFRMAPDEKGKGVPVFAKQAEEIMGACALTHEDHENIVRAGRGEGD